MNDYAASLITDSIELVTSQLLMVVETLLSAWLYDLFSFSAFYECIITWLFKAALGVTVGAKYTEDGEKSHGIYSLRGRGT